MPTMIVSGLAPQRIRNLSCARYSIGEAPTAAKLNARLPVMDVMTIGESCIIRDEPRTTTCGGWPCLTIAKIRRAFQERLLWLGTIGEGNIPPPALPPG